VGKITVAEVLKSVRAGKETKLVVLLKGSTVEAAVDALFAASLVSAPVVNADSTVLGYLDVLDIAAFIINRWKAVSPELDKEKLPNDLGATLVETIPAGTVPIVSSSAPLSALIKAVHSNAAERYQRVLVVDGGKAVDVVTLSDIVAFINSHFGSLGALGKSSLASLQLTRPAVTVKAKSPVSEAILTVVSNKLSGVAITNEEGDIVGDITGADLRRAKLFPYAWIFFQRTVWDFKQQSVSPFGWEEFSGLKDEPYHRDFKPIVGALETNSFSDLVYLVSKGRAHRVFVTDSANKLTGVVTLGNLIEAFGKASN
jgi:CBS domain-containing protein